MKERQSAYAATQETNDDDVYDDTANLGRVEQLSKPEDDDVYDDTANLERPAEKAAPIVPPPAHPPADDDDDQNLYQVRKNSKNF